MQRILLKGGWVITPENKGGFEKKDILIEEGKIVKISKEIEDKLHLEIIDASDKYIAPGFIDVHTHCFLGKSPIGTEADSIGIKKGATTIFDAGTAGPLNFERFKKEGIERSKTTIYSILNVSDFGLDRLDELTNLSEIDFEKIKKTYSENKEYIKGIKVRASKSVVGENGIKPIEVAKEISSKLELPLVVHIGNYPPHIDEVINLLEKDDIVTHAYHGKQNGIFDKDGNLRNSIVEAQKRGVLFDVGHGSASFSFKTFKKALDKGLRPDLISTDMYNANMEGPVFSLLSVLNKIIELGIPLEECIEKVTNYPVKLFKLEEKIGKIEKGYKADFTIFSIEEVKEVLIDSIGDKLDINKKLNLCYTIKARGESCEIYRNS